VTISAERAQALLFVGKVPERVATCRKAGSDGAQIRCMLAVRYADDAQARELAVALYDIAGSVAGVEEPHRMDGGWRGMIDLVPEPPVGAHRRHLTWLLAAARDHDAFFEGLARASGKTIGYRHAPIELKFFRSVGRTTPSAYASGWSIAWNVSGSLHVSEDAARETMFHETFHLNDRAHGHWSESALTPHFDAVMARCTTSGRLSTPCLTPYAPNRTMVRGGTYYAFQPGNGVWEYAAELAIRYYKEHRTQLANQPLGERAFKCGPDPNGTTWKLLVDAFFDGVDLTPACTP
jgi:hypothetical protein